MRLFLHTISTIIILTQSSIQYELIIHNMDSNYPHIRLQQLKIIHEKVLEHINKRKKLTNNHSENHQTTFFTYLLHALLVVEGSSDSLGCSWIV
jgi:hypothetical protein